MVLGSGSFWPLCSSIQLITVNVTNVAQIAPSLQDNQSRIYEGYALFGVEREEAPNS